MKTTKFHLSQTIKRLKVKRKENDAYIHLFWCLDYPDDDPSEDLAYLMTKEQIKESTFGEHIECPAYTLDELLKILPVKTSLFDGEPAFLVIKKNLDLRYTACYEYSKNNNMYPSCFYNENPAQAAGQLLCWCVENGYVEVGDINKEDRQL